MRAHTEALAFIWTWLCSPEAPPPPHNASGGVVFIVIQVIVEADDGADELSQLHKVSRYDVDAVLPGPLRSDPLHHPGQGPGRTKSRKKRNHFTQRGPRGSACGRPTPAASMTLRQGPHQPRYSCRTLRVLYLPPVPGKQYWRMSTSKSLKAWWERLIAELLSE